MNDKQTDPELERLKAMWAEKKMQLELEGSTDHALQLYKELKALQYEISMTSARMSLSAERVTRTASA